jgi:DHA2 family methylenomycin A resistance protein-like MFS transporter
LTVMTRPGTSLSLFALCLGYFVVIMDATIVTTALPVIGKDLNAGITGLQWVVDGYTLVFASLLLTAGSAGDRLGARRVFMAGLALFTVSSLACGLAPTMAVLNVTRAVQGLGAALVVPTSLALINASYPDRERRARAIGVWGALGGVAAGLGPVLGGVFTTWLGWPSVFFVNVPIGVGALLLTHRFVVAPPPRARTGLDPRGQVLAVVTLAMLAFGLIEAGGRGWGSPVVLAAFAVAVAGTVAFVLAENRHQDPMLPLGLFRDRGFTGAAVAGAAINFGFYGEIFLLSLYFQQLRGYTPLIAGLAIFPQPGIASVVSSLSGRQTARRGARSVMLIGLVVGAAGLFAMTMAGPSTPYWILLLPLLAIGFGISYTMPAATAAIIDAAPADRAGIASGALNASRQVGSTLGVAVFGSLVAATTSFVTAFQVSVIIGGVVFAAAAVLTAVTIPQQVRRGRGE